MNVSGALSVLVDDEQSAEEKKGLSPSKVSTNQNAQPGEPSLPKVAVGLNASKLPSLKINLTGTPVRVDRPKPIQVKVETAVLLPNSSNMLCSNNLADFEIGD